MSETIEKKKQEWTHKVFSNIPDFPDFSEDGTCHADGETYHVYWAAELKGKDILMNGMDVWLSDEASVKAFMSYLKENFSVVYAKVIKHTAKYMDDLSL